MTRGSLGGQGPVLDVARARAGDRTAVESVVRAVQRDVYALVLRFLWHPEDVSALTSA